MRPDRTRHAIRAAALAWLATIGLTAARADVIQTWAVFNTTGIPANDLHFETARPILAAAATAPAWPVVAGPVGNRVDFAGAPAVPNGGSIDVTWRVGGFVPDRPLNSTFWTFNGNGIGNARFGPLAWRIVGLAGGQSQIQLVSLSSSDLSYSGLVVYSDISTQYFNMDEFFTQAPTGTAVTPLVSPSGTLLAGQVLAVADVAQPGGDGTYLAFGVNITDPDDPSITYFANVGVVPEPSSLLLCGLGVGLGTLGVLRHRRAARGL